MTQSGEHPVEHSPVQSEGIESTSDRAKDAAAEHFASATGTPSGAQRGPQESVSANGDDADDNTDVDGIEGAEATTPS